MGEKLVLRKRFRVCAGGERTSVSYSTARIRFVNGSTLQYSECVERGAGVTQQDINTLVILAATTTVPRQGLIHRSPASGLWFDDRLRSRWFDCEQPPALAARGGTTLRRGERSGSNEPVLVVTSLIWIRPCHAPCHTAVTVTVAGGIITGRSKALGRRFESNDSCEAVAQPCTHTIAT